MPGFRRRTSFTDLPPNASKELVALQDAILQDTGSLRAEAIGQTTDTKNANYAVRYYEVVRCTAPAAGIALTFPAADPTSQNKWIAVIVMAGSGNVTLRPTSLKIDGLSSVVLNAPGLYWYLSDGVSSWWRAPAGSSGGSTPTGTGFRHVTAGVEDAAAKLVDTADINNNQVSYAKFQQGAANTIPANATAGSANFADLAMPVDSMLIRSAGNIQAPAMAAQSLYIKSGGNLFNVTAAAGQHLRRSIAGGDLGMSALEVGAMGTPLVANATSTNTTNAVAATFTIPANSLVAGSTFLFTAYFTYVHTAEGTLDVIGAIALAGTEIAVATTDVLSIAKASPGIGGMLSGILTFRTVGAGGTAIANCKVDYDLQTANSTHGSTVTATVAANTTGTLALELRLRLAAAAVAGNTLTVTHGVIQRLN